MADIRVDIDMVLTDGMDIAFKAPCDCTAISGIKVCYVKDKELVSQRFVLKDAHGNDLAGIGNLFEEGAYIRVILNTVNGFAYIQNADTNGYIEAKFASIPTVYTGTTNPDNSVGKNGDLYFKLL